MASWPAIKRMAKPRAFGYSTMMLWKRLPAAMVFFRQGSLGLASV
jgi:hypothetical protein